jgi:hypothetical protein
MHMPTYGRCRLCLTDQPLVDSHIISNFLFRPLKEKEGLFYVLSSDPKKKELKQQRGITERLLCAKCDNERLQKNEKHLREVLFGGHSLDGRQDGRFLFVRGYDYKRVKNGLLSLLWRMSITSREYFSAVDLGEKHAEAIRLSLLNDTEFSEEEYPILLAAPLFEGQFLGDWMLPPDFSRTGGNRVYRCLISGFLFTFFVGSAPLDPKLAPLILRREEWPIIKARVDEIPFLNDTCLLLGRANAIRKAQATV